MQFTSKDDSRVVIYAQRGFKRMATGQLDYEFKSHFCEAMPDTVLHLNAHLSDFGPDWYAYLMVKYTQCSSMIVKAMYRYLFRIATLQYRV